MSYRVGFQNFYVITRYNSSPLYAMAVHDLAQAIWRADGAGGGALSLQAQQRRACARCVLGAGVHSCSRRATPHRAAAPRRARSCAGATAARHGAAPARPRQHPRRRAALRAAQRLRQSAVLRGRRPSLHRAVQRRRLPRARRGLLVRTEFDGLRTATGEPYDMFAMTAAHKTLPLPCYARVTNLTNGRSVVVRINDRGPFVANRIIDLSYTAAAKLDMIRSGTAFVEVEALMPLSSTAAALPVSGRLGRERRREQRATDCSSAQPAASIECPSTAPRRHARRAQLLHSGRRLRAVASNAERLRASCALRACSTCCSLPASADSRCSACASDRSRACRSTIS